MARRKNDSEHLRNCRQQAAEWLLRLQEPRMSPEVLLEWERWLKAHTDNRRAFDDAERLSATIERRRGDLISIPLPGKAELETDTYDGSMPVTACREARTPATLRLRRLPGRMTWWGTAATLVLAVGMVVALQTDFFEPGPATGLLVYETAGSEHRDIDLPDGSTIALGAASALSVNFSSDRRTVVMEVGEALFDVAKDSDRPFVVVAGSGTITAVGTSFNVRRNADRVLVIVTEGRVEVAQATPANEPRVTTATNGGMPTPRPARTTLTVGERAVYDADGLSRLDNVEPATATVWREGQLRYRSEPLKHVIPDVERYSRREIIIGDRSVGELTFTGTVFQSNVDEWVAGLEQIFAVEVVELEGDKVLLRTRARPSPD